VGLRGEYIPILGWTRSGALFLCGDSTLTIFISMSILVIKKKSQGEKVEVTRVSLVSLMSSLLLDLRNVTRCYVSDFMSIQRPIEGYLMHGRVISVGKTKVLALTREYLAQSFYLPGGLPLRHDSFIS
jgi:hypothetical protein